MCGVRTEPLVYDPTESLCPATLRQSKKFALAQTLPSRVKQRFEKTHPLTVSTK